MNRSAAHRKALAKSLIRGLLVEFDRKDYIITTHTKAKFTRPQAEKMISLARTKSVHNIRRAMRILQDRELVAKLFDEIGPYYAQRPGGYTRIVRLAQPRLGDCAPRAYFGFVRDEIQKASEPKSDQESTAEAPAKTSAKASAKAAKKTKTVKTAKKSKKEK
ncbi:MAG: 50S ribosomal protein L17 [Planctomycetota bacterium]